jgi:hypothetical protein
MRPAVAGNAYASDLSSNPDEAAHFVTGLMAPRLHAPISMERSNALRKKTSTALSMVAIGHWPPLFYLAQAL